MDTDCLDYEILWEDLTIGEEIGQGKAFFETLLNLILPALPGKSRISVNHSEWTSGLNINLFRILAGQDLGFEDFTPPYLAPTTSGSVVLKGVNYASGGGGILNHTGKIFGGRINFDAQIDNFANTRQDIISSIGLSSALELFSKSLFSVTMGSNDFINNYLTPVLSAPVQKLVSPEQFVATMISRYRLQLTRLYNLGARKVVVVNVGPIGCIPYQRDTNPAAGDSCVELPNQLAKSFNTQLKSLVAELSTTLEGSKFVYADVYNIVQDILDSYTTYGFENQNSACCYSAGRFGGLIPCGPPSKVCLDRSKYVFWDAYHPPPVKKVYTRRTKGGLVGDSGPIGMEGKELGPKTGPSGESVLAGEREADVGS
ncbi:GDSL esterase/lipase [Morus notabilis]|uniref:GDSL esterase/lipase n=1 Tax=Morus notabilis TaxID=981085 RepID=W9S3V6_9ROSA|nr:GDSL esterase/lipase [Morus notabilis]